MSVTCCRLGTDLFVFMSVFLSVCLSISPSVLKSPRNQMNRKISQILGCMIFGKIMVPNELNNGITPSPPLSEIVAPKSYHPKHHLQNLH